MLDVFLFVAVDDGCEDTGQIVVQLDFVEFAGLDERREYGPVLGACIVAREERVLSLQGDCAFDSVAVHLDAAIAEEQDQPVPVFGDVFERVTRWGFGRDLCTGVIQPCFEGRNLRRAFGLAQRQSILS